MKPVGIGEPLWTNWKHLVEISSPHFSPWWGRHSCLPRQIRHLWQTRMSAPPNSLLCVFPVWSEIRARGHAAVVRAHRGSGESNFRSTAHRFPTFHSPLLPATRGSVNRQLLDWGKQASDRCRCVSRSRFSSFFPYSARLPQHVCYQRVASRRRTIWPDRFASSIAIGFRVLFGGVEGMMESECIIPERTLEHATTFSCCRGVGCRIMPMLPAFGDAERSNP